MLTKQRNKRFVLFLFIVLMSVRAASAQTTDFTYQGRLTNSALPANGNHDFEFKLYDALTGGTLLGTRGRELVPVTNGVFTVRLDFPPALFDGANRFLEISVRASGSPDPLTPLLPRQPMTGSPYAILSLNATQLGGINASQYVQTNDSRLSDARNPLPNSSNYVQNTTSQQTSSNFNISGNGTVGGTLSANTVNAATQFNLAGNRILGNPGTNNLFAGVSAGFNNTTGSSNSFFGLAAGNANVTGSSNSFFGASAGINNTATGNSFFGSTAGSGNTSGINNSFFGRNAGNDNTTGNGNSFFGNGAGAVSLGSANSFFGSTAGSANTSGDSNTFIGNAAGNSNTTGSNNTIIGAGADVGSTFLAFATAIGAGAVVETSNTVRIGRSTDRVSIPGQILAGSNVSIFGVVTFSSLAGGGTSALCRNTANELAACSSSLRYKTELQPFTGGLDLVRRLRPISFSWKGGGLRDVGFGAEEVEQIEPLLTTYNAKGEIEGVKYEQLTTVLVNAVNEQQKQLDELRKLVQSQQAFIDVLKKSPLFPTRPMETCKKEK